MKLMFVLFTALMFFSCSSRQIESVEDLKSANAIIEKLAGDFKFTEGPANDDMGNVYFTDIPNSRIHKYSPETGKTTVFMENSGGANGLWITDKGILACQGNNRHISLISMDGRVKVLADKFDGKTFNKPNDVWPDSKGGIYFSDPNYRKEPKTQEGECVYYLKPDGKTVICVICDFKRPNGIIGTNDGKIFYATDIGSGKTYSYSINDDGTLSNKKLLAEEGSDGMTLDELGNLYLTKGAVKVYSPTGKKLGEIKFPEGSSNVCFGGKGGMTLFVTAKTGFYSLKMSVKGMYTK